MREGGKEGGREGGREEKRERGRREGGSEGGKKRKEKSNTVPEAQGSHNTCSITLCAMLYTNILTFSPISVMSPPGRISRSGSRAHAWIVLPYSTPLMCLPKRMLSFKVAFWIHAC